MSETQLQTADAQESAPQDDATQIILITGYLGAGKTTLLNHILTNRKGIRAAVIVNDIGEVNVDASLIRDGGLSQVDGDVIPLTNGCICCTLSDDLAEQLDGLAASPDIDYIFIEASGICEPVPIAYTLAAFCDADGQENVAPLRLDNLVAVVDAARMYDEFNGGRDLISDDIDEEDIESLLVQQIEFCTTLILNKADMVTSEQMACLRAIVRSLQKDAVIIEAENANVALEELLDTGRFDFAAAYNSAAWTDAEEHPEEHENPEVLEYGISTFVYERRQPFDMEALGAYASTWPSNIIRAKGMMWGDVDFDMCYVFEQAGKQISATENGLFYAAATGDELEKLLEEDPSVRDIWDEECGDRMTRICFIGRDIDRAAIEAALDACLTEWVR